MMKRIAEASPHLKARIAGAISCFAIIMGILAEFLARGRFGSFTYLIATSCNIPVTVLFCDSQRLT
jgi:hypothetical protein